MGSTISFDKVFAVERALARLYGTPRHYKPMPAFGIDMMRYRKRMPRLARYWPL